MTAGSVWSLRAMGIAAAVGLLAGRALSNTADEAATVADARRPPRVEAVRAFLEGTRPLRIGLGSGSRIGLRPSGAAALYSGGGAELLYRVRAGELVTVTCPDGRLVVETRDGRFDVAGQGVELRLTGTAGHTSVRLAGTPPGPYPGDFEFASPNGELLLINLVTLSEYVARVVSAELPPGWGMEAAKAQAIAVRSYTLASLGDHTTEGYDLCGTVHCQVYRGREPTPEYQRAARATRGMVLAHGGRIVKAYYHSHCGGVSARRPWSGAEELIPYLAWRTDDARAAPPEFADDNGVYEWIWAARKRDVRPGDLPYCEQVRPGQWARTYDRATLQRLIATNLPRLTTVASVGTVGVVRVLSRDPSGRVDRLEVETSTGAYVVTGEDIRWLFGEARPGAGGLPSRVFVARWAQVLADTPAARAFLVDGIGRGHGWGLCQWGTYGRARAEQTARQILAHYFPQTELVDAR